MSSQPSTSPRDRFNRAATGLTAALGSPIALLAAAALIVGWAVTGPLFNFSSEWQLIINTGTTIITFLMVFVIQASQNRDSKAIHLKLDEIIRSQSGARNELIAAEQSSEEKLREHEEEFLKIAERGGVEAVRSIGGDPSESDAAAREAAASGEVRAAVRSAAERKVQHETKAPKAGRTPAATRNSAGK